MEFKVGKAEAYLTLNSEEGTLITKGPFSETFSLVTYKKEMAFNALVSASALVRFVPVTVIRIS